MLVRLLSTSAFCGLLASCGGGGGGGSPDTSGGGTPPVTTPGAATFKTYQNKTLPGRLVVNSPLGDAVVVDLQTGDTRSLPASGIKSANSPDGDEWQSTGMSAFLLRFNETQLAGDSGPNVRVAVFDSVASTSTNQNWKLPGNFAGNALVSPDGKKALAFYAAGGEDPQLTVWDLQTGNVLKRGSLLDGESILDTPVTWLPDGRYAYLVNNRLIASSSGSITETELARFTALPSNNAANWQGYISGQSTLVASPDGKRVAFSWVEKRGSDLDKHVWVADIDGSRLHRLTKVADESSPLSFRFVSPSWSPDSQWVVALLDMHATATAPLFPPSPYDDAPPPLTVSGTTSCGNSQVIVFTADADREAISWPTLDASHGVKVKTQGGQPAWVTSCRPVSWTP